MGNRRRNLFILLFVVGLVLASLLVIMNKPTRQGLDLKGGTELIYQGRPTPKVPKVTPQAITDAIETIRKRTDALGVSEPEIQRAGSDQISIGLPAVKNAARAEQQDQQSADDPVELARVLIGAEQEHARHVEEHQDDEDARAPLVHPAHQPAKRDVVRDVLDRLVRVLRVSLVVHRKDHAGERLHEERSQRRRAERVPPAGVARNLPEQEVLDSTDQARALFEPVDRIVDRGAELLAAGGLLVACSSRHQCGGCNG